LSYDSKRSAILARIKPSSSSRRLPSVKIKGFRAAPGKTASDAKIILTIELEATATELARQNFELGIAEDDLRSVVHSAMSANEYNKPFLGVRYQSLDLGKDGPARSRGGHTVDLGLDINGGPAGYRKIGFKVVPVSTAEDRVSIAVDEVTIDGRSVPQGLLAWTQERVVNFVSSSMLKHGSESPIRIENSGRLMVDGQLSGRIFGGTLTEAYAHLVRIKVVPGFLAMQYRLDFSKMKSGERQCHSRSIELMP
jgi:hypothetical protein